MVSLFSKWDRGLRKTRQGLVGRITDVFKGKDRIDETLLDELEQVLIEGDVGVDTAMEIIDDVRDGDRDSDMPVEKAVRLVLKEKISEILGRDGINDFLLSDKKPHVILVVGVNGTGKTTTIGKLAHRYRQQGKKVLLAAADTFRAAAGEQLDVWAKRADADVIRQCMGADPASVAFDALNAAQARGVDVLIIDTAGRLHTKVNLMEELKKVPRVLQKRTGDAPHEVLLVLDATTGQNGLSQAKLFTEAVGVTGIVLTKLDGTARGGIVLAIHKELGIPVQWVGLGEGLEDIEPFDAGRFSKGLFGE